MIFGYNRGVKKVKDPVKAELQAVEDDEEFEDLGIEAANITGKTDREITLIRLELFLCQYCQLC